MKQRIYLNNGATSYPKPESVLRGVSEFLCEVPFHHGRAGFSNGTYEVVSSCRSKLAAMFNAPDASRIVFSSGATESLNTILFGLPLDGKHVITTTVEHNSVLRPLKTMERDGRISLSIVPCDACGRVSVDGIEDAVRENTAALVVNHCSNVTGIANDITAIGALARRHNILFIVDASQSAGVYPIDVQNMTINALVFAGHKSLFGIQGIGGAYIPEGLPVTPLKVGGTGIRSDYLYQPEEVPLLYEAGTMNMPGIVALDKGLDYIREHGIRSLRKKKEKLVDGMTAALSCWDNVHVYPSRESGLQPTLFSFTIDGIEPEDIAYILEQNYGIIVRSGLHCAPLIHQCIGTSPNGSVRVSPSHFTSDEEAGRFIESIAEIVQMAG